MRQTWRVAAVGMTMAVAGGVLWAQGTGHGGHGTHGGHGMHGMAEPSVAQTAFIAANERMHAGMALGYTGDADVDFLRGMIPHHEGAVEMARIVMEHGQDPDVRAFAQDIIDAQKHEIAWMKGWLASRGY